MAGIFEAMNIASRALSVTQNQLQNTSHNIANVNTPGYSRQRVETSTLPPEFSGAGFLGKGVKQDTVIRITDEFLQQQLVEQEGQLGSSTTQASVLSQIERLFDESEVTGASKELAAFYGALGDLASSDTPRAPNERLALVEGAKKLTDTFQRLDRQLRSQQQGLDLEIRGSVDQINSLTTQIADLNQKIAAEDIFAPANDLRDRRDLLIRELSQKVDVRTFEQTNGMFDVYIGGRFNVVGGTNSTDLGVAPDALNPFSPGFASVILDPQGVAADITSGIGGGDLGGLIQGRDVLVGDAIRALDTVAFNLAQSVNTQHQLGYGLDAVNGRDFFAPLAGLDNAARDIRLDAAIAADASLIASAGDPAALESDNQNALDLAALGTTQFVLTLPGAALSSPMSVKEYADSLVTRFGLDAQRLNDSQQQQQQIMDVLQDRRDEISGVSLDEEMVHLIELERVYQANSRMIQSMDELLSEIINIL